MENTQDLSCAPSVFNYSSIQIPQRHSPSRTPNKLTLLLMRQTSFVSEYLSYTKKRAGAFQAMHGCNGIGSLIIFIIPPSPFVPPSSSTPHPFFIRSEWIFLPHFPSWSMRSVYEGCRCVRAFIVFPFSDFGLASAVLGVVERLVFSHQMFCTRVTFNAAVIILRRQH